MPRFQLSRPVVLIFQCYGLSAFRLAVSTNTPQFRLSKFFVVSPTVILTDFTWWFLSLHKYNTPKSMLPPGIECLHYSHPERTYKTGGASRASQVILHIRQFGDPLPSRLHNIGIINPGQRVGIFETSPRKNSFQLDSRILLPAVMQRIS